MCVNLHNLYILLPIDYLNVVILLSMELKFSMTSPLWRIFTLVCVYLALNTQAGKSTAVEVELAMMNTYVQEDGYELQQGRAPASNMPIVTMQYAFKPSEAWVKEDKSSRRGTEFDIRVSVPGLMFSGELCARKSMGKSEELRASGLDCKSINRRLQYRMYTVQAQKGTDIYEELHKQSGAVLSNKVLELKEPLVLSPGESIECQSNSYRDHCRMLLSDPRNENAITYVSVVKVYEVDKPIILEAMTTDLLIRTKLSEFVEKSAEILMVKSKGPNGKKSIQLK